MTKLLALGGAGLAALGVLLAVALAGGGTAVPTVGTLTGVAGVTGTTGTTTSTTATTGATTTRGREPGEDVRGPCDEAEHADDPRCTGAVTTDDRRGRGRGGDDDDRRGRGRGGDDDRSGSNSGRG